MATVPPVHLLLLFNDLLREVELVMFAKDISLNSNHHIEEVTEATM